VRVADCRGKRAALVAEDTGYGESRKAEEGRWWRYPTRAAIECRGGSVDKPSSSLSQANVFRVCTNHPRRPRWLRFVSTRL